MKSSRIFNCAIALIVGMTASAVGTAAQRTFVASYGNDFDACTIAAPCRGFARALAQTDFNGEIIALDSAGYGTVTISQSVAIIAPPGVYAGISVSSGNGITINGANIAVTLRGLTINGQGGVDGIHVALAGTVHIENCVVSNMTGDGVDIADDATILIKDSLIRDNDGRGVFLEDIASVSTLRIDRSRIERNGQQGIYVEPTSKLTVYETTLADNGLHGVEIRANTGQTIIVEIVRALVRGNGDGGIYIQSYHGGVAIAAVSDSVVADNNGHGINAYSLQAETRLSADRNTLVRNLYTGLTSTNSTTTVIASNNVAMYNGIGFSRPAAASFKTLGNNLVEENTVDTHGLPTIVSGK